VKSRCVGGVLAKAVTGGRNNYFMRFVPHTSPATHRTTLETCSPFDRISDVKMKIKALSRSASSHMEPGATTSRVPRNLDPALHPFEVSNSPMLVRHILTDDVSAGQRVHQGSYGNEDGVWESCILVFNHFLTSHSRRMFAAPFLASLGTGHVDGVYCFAKDPESLDHFASGSGGTIQSKRLLILNCSLT
jgi:hypothetical protein